MSVKRGVISPRLRNNTPVRHKRFNILKATFCFDSSLRGSWKRGPAAAPAAFYILLFHSSFSFSPPLISSFAITAQVSPPPSAHRGASTLLLLLLIGSLRWVVGPPTYELTRCLEDWLAGWLAGCLGRAGWAERTAAVQKQTPPV